MTHASLFSGIGGFDLAAHWAGFQNLFNCEIDPFCQAILKYHFPYATQYSDIKTTDFTPWRGRVDILTGGFPCQPFSVAGKRKGTDDDRYLWPEMLRAIREISPSWIVGENVRGIVNWSKGLVFEQVCADLEAEGYEVQPFVIPACGVDAPHRRDRVWFIAHRTDAGDEDVQQQGQDGVPGLGITTYANSAGSSSPKDASIRNGASNSKEWEHSLGRTNRLSYYGATTDPAGDGLQAWDTSRTSGERVSLTGFDGFPTQSPVCGRNDGLSARLDGITFPKWRAESIRGFGNAIVPQVALQIFSAINEINRI